MPMNIGIGGFILIFLIALLLFGPSKLPQLGKALGTTIREFRQGTKEMLDESQSKSKDEHLRMLFIILRGYSLKSLTLRNSPLPCRLNLSIRVKLVLHFKLIAVYEFRYRNANFI